MRPIKLLPGLVSPLKNDKIDFVVIRENSEGEYCGKGSTTSDRAVQESVFTRKGTERIIRYAYEYAKANNMTRVLSATKSNALNHSMVFWDKIFDEVRAEYPQMESSQMHIDALAGYFIMHPERLEVVVASNLFGDILTDLGSAMLGSIGISPSANLNPEGKYPSMFEPIHGSAPDIAGQDKANPTAMLMSAIEMLNYIDEREAGEKIRKALFATLEAGIKTADLGGSASCTQFTQAIIERL